MREAADRRRAGNPSYAGYEYQIEVTAWLALDLLVARGIAGEISIEDPTCEDVETVIEEHTIVGDAAEGRPFSIQIKSKSTGPWTSAEFIKVLTGEKAGKDKDPSKAGAPGVEAEPAEITKPEEVGTLVETPHHKPGPPKRERPLAMLKTDPRRGYVFISDAAVEESLMRYEVASVGDSSDAEVLPGRSGRDLGEGAAAVAERIAVMPGLSREVVAARTNDLLQRIGHVPSVHGEACRKELVEAVRRRVLGEETTPLQRVEVVEILRRHHGSLLPTVQMDRYVGPRCLPEIEAMLAKRNAVIIVGPSGTGKTLTAEVLEARLLDEGVGFETVTKEGGLEAIATKLKTTDPVVFHLRDPWGSLRPLPDAIAWTEALGKLLRSAKPDKKFLITTRSDVLHDAGGLTGELIPYIVAIEPEDYDDEARARIYDNHAAGLGRPARELAARFRERAVATLRRPFEIERFLAILEVTAPGRSRFDDLVRRSQGEAIALVVERQILASARSADAVAATSVVWSLAATLGTVPRGTITAVRRRMTKLDRAFKVEVEGFVDTMVQARNLRTAAGSVAMAHPQVERGFRGVMSGNAAGAEAALDLLIRALVDLGSELADGWGTTTANELRARILELDGIGLDLERSVADALDVDLVRTVMQADDGDFVRRLDRLASLAGDALPAARLARLLRPRRHRTPRGFGYSWKPPPDAEDAARGCAADETCRILATRMIADALPSTSTSYDGRLATLLRAVDPNVDAAFLEAITSGSIERFTNPRNLRVVVEGALAGAEPAYDAVLETFLHAQRDVDAHRAKLVEGLRAAREEVLDEAYARHLDDAASDEGFVLEEGFREVVAIIRRREGWGWLAAHPAGRELLPHWIGAAASGDPPTSASEIAVLLDLTISEDERAGVWLAASKSPAAGSRDTLLAEMPAPGSGRALRRARLAAFVALGGADWRADLVSFADPDAIGDARVVEIVLDLAAARRDDDDDAPPTSLDWLLGGLPSELSAMMDPVLDGEGADRPPVEGAVQVASRFPSERAARMLEDVAVDVGAAVLSAMPAAAAPGDVLARYVTSADAGAAVAALHVMAARTDAGAELIHDALGHASMLVRETAVGILMQTADDPRERVRISKRAAGDESSRVRLAFAREMAKSAWPEARDELCDLLRDDRDFDDNPLGEDGRTFEVARAAAQALRAQPELEMRHLEALRSVVDNPTGDPEVSYTALRALETRPGGEIGRWLSSVALREAYAGVREQDRTIDLAWEAYFSLARRGAAGMPLDDASYLDRLASASTVEGSDAAVAALLAAATNLDAARLELCVDALSEDARALLVVTAMLVRPFALRERLAEKLHPQTRMCDEAAAAIHRARGEAGDDAAVADALAGHARLGGWARGLGGHPAASYLRTVFDDLGLWPPPERSP